MIFGCFRHGDGVEDNVGFAEQLAREAKVGIAPGSAFDPTMKSWFRICFANDEATLNDAFNKMEAFMERTL